jgi:hypothetical protein
MCGLRLTRRKWDNAVFDCVPHGPSITKHLCVAIWEEQPNGAELASLTFQLILYLQRKQSPTCHPLDLFLSGTSFYRLVYKYAVY